MERDELARLENRRQRKRLLVELLELTRQQEQLLNQGDYEALAQVGGRWKEVARAAAQVQAQCAPQELDTDGECQALLKEIDALHRQNAARVQGEVDDFKGQIKSMQRSNERVQSYTNPFTGGEDGVYFNRKR